MRHRPHIRHFAGLLAAGALATGAQAQSPMEIEHLFEIGQVGSAALSPDGEHVAYTLSDPRHIAEGEEITVDYNACAGYDVREDAAMRDFLALCARYGVVKRPSEFRKPALALPRRGHTSAAHRDALFVVPHAAVTELAVAGRWRALGALTRINALTCCKGAEHGWPGASFSVLDILVCLHQRLCGWIDDVVLAKGHAAALALLAAADPNVLTGDGLTAAHVSAVAGWGACVRAVEAAGADLELRTPGGQSVWLACARGDINRWRWSI